MLRSLLLLAGLLGLLASADAATASGPWFSNPNRRILAGNHRPNYTRYGHHGLSRSGLFNLFRANGSGIAKKKHLAKGPKGHARRGTL